MLIDVSMRIKEGMVFRKGSPPISIKEIECFSEGEVKYSTWLLSAPTHSGTHVDVIRKDRPIPVDRFLGRGITIDISKISDRPVSMKDLKISSPIKENDFVFFRTGWDKYLNKEKYFDHPELSFEVIEWLANKKINMVGIDAPGLGKRKNHGLYDKFLADKNVYVIENLTNLDLIKKKIFKVYCFPFSVENFEAIHARVVVEI